MIAYTGDGVMTRIKESSFFFPAVGYLVQNASFDLSRNYTAKYKLGNLPNISSRLGVYLVIGDKCDVYVQNGIFTFTILDGSERVLKSYSGALNNMIHSSPPKMVSGCFLYSLKDSFLELRKGSEYFVSVSYVTANRFTCQSAEVCFYSAKGGS